VAQPESELRQVSPNILQDLVPAMPTVPCEAAGCPDLTGDAGLLAGAYLASGTWSATSCAVQEGMITEGTHQLVRFTSAIPNKGPGDLVIGSPFANPERFTYSYCHGHYHLKAYADYRVWTPENYNRFVLLKGVLTQYSSQQIIDLLPDAMKPLSGNKQGFCVYDVARYAQYGGSDTRRFTGCGFMGMSRGWADVYGSGLDGQWVVLDGLAPGTYILEQEPNAARFYQEADYLNNGVAVNFQVP
jgi:hypothetical protein